MLLMAFIVDSDSRAARLSLNTPVALYAFCSVKGRVTENEASSTSSHYYSNLFRMKPAPYTVVLAQFFYLIGQTARPFVILKSEKKALMRYTITCIVVLG